jgi:RHS repeat-associated protein
MSRTSRNLILLLTVVLGLGGRAFAADASITISGAETQPSGVWDTGSITISFGDSAGNSYSEIVAYGQYSTPASIASAFGAKFSNDYFPSGLLCAHAVGSVIYFHLKGTDTFGLLSITNPSVSFSFNPTGWPLPQAITFNALPSSVVFGSTPLELSATGGGSGNPVIFSVVSGPGALINEYNGNELNLTGAGTIVVAANQAGSTNYAAAPMVQQTVQVLPASPLLSLTTSGTPSTSGASIILTATIGVGPDNPELTNPNYAGPTGKVKFYDTYNGVPTTLGTVTVTSINSGVNNILEPVNTSATLNVILPTNTQSACVHITCAHYIAAAFLPDIANIANYNSVTTASITQMVETQAILGPGIINTVVGSNTIGSPTNSSSIGDGGPATSANLLFADGVALDSSGNLYIADGYNRIRKVTPLTATTGTITTYVGNGTTCAVPTATPYACGDSGAAASAQLNDPIGVAVDSSGNLYIADSADNRIRKVTPAGIISTIAGTGTAGYTGDSGAAISAELSYPDGIAVDSSSNLYIADTGNNVIRKVVLSSGIITTVAGNGTTGYSGDGGAAISAQLNFPTGVAVDASGNIYVADYNNQAIREVTVPNNIINTVSGNGTWGYSGDGGPATNAQLNGPRGVFVSATGNIYIADSANNVIREVIASSGLITTIAGNGTLGYSGDDGPATIAQLDLPWGVALDAAGNVYIADTTNGRIRAVGAVQITPAINWAPPAPIVYGTTLASTLSASSAVPGTFTYSYLVGTTVTPVTTTTVLHPGTYAITATFNPTDAVDYATNSITVNLTVYPATPIATWITTTHVYGTPLGPNPNLVNFNVAGTITYQPASALTSTLDAGTYVLTAAFTPTDTVDYTTASSEAPITITATTTTYDSGTVTLTVNGSTAASYVYGAGTHGATETPSTVAAGLAAANSSSLVTLTAVDDTVYIQASATGTASDYPYSLSISHSGSFTNGSFAASPASGALDGGAASTSNGSSATVYSFTNAFYDPVGNLISYNDFVMGNWSDSYDSLNRLVSAKETAAPPLPEPSPYTGDSLCWGYDPFGNRTAQSIQSAACPTLPTQPGQTAFYNSANRSTSLQYDNSGDVDFDPATANQYLYDAEGRICAVATTPIPSMTVLTGYIYDAGGTRVAKGTISSWSCNPAVNGFKTVNDYVLGLGGEQVTEMGVDTTAGSGTTTLAWQHTNVFAGGKLLGTYDKDGLHFYFDDPLGTRRAQTDYAGHLEQTCQSLPFGDQLACTGGDLQAPTEHHFTGKERDTESGNDYFMARYYSSAMGRFMSPDWSAKEDPVPYAKLDDPQSLNLYAYVRNNPMIRIDADGHCDWCDKLWNAGKAVVNSVYIKSEAGLGLKAQVKLGPAKVEVGAKSVREVDAKSNNKGTIKYVNEASAKVKIGPVSVGPSISQEQTVKTGNSPENLDAPKEVHGNLLYDLGKNTTGSNSEVGVGVGLFVGVGGSVEVGVDAKELVQGVHDAFTGQQSAPAPPANPQ